MNARLASLLVVVASLAGYHVAQRSMPHALRPAPLFAFVYGACTVAMLTVATVSTDDRKAVATVATHWAPWLLALSVVGIELGYYAMYRSGWGISTASITVQAVVATALVVVGLARFGEHLTVTKVIGMALCVVGAGLVTR